MTETVTRRGRNWVVDVVEDVGTANSSVTKVDLPPATRTAAALLTENADDLRHRVGSLGIHVTETNQKIYEHEWNVLTQQRGSQSPVSLLKELGDRGLAWRDVARLLGVSVPAIKKWRTGERITGANRAKLARLVAAFDFLVDHYHVVDIASWIEMPLREDAPITPIDLWISGRSRLLFDYGTRHATADETLDAFDPEWRERYRTNVETFRGADGNLGLRIADR